MYKGAHTCYNIPHSQTKYRNNHRIQYKNAFLKNNLHTQIQKKVTSKKIIGTSNTKKDKKEIIVHE